MRHATALALAALLLAPALAAAGPAKVQVHGELVLDPAPRPAIRIEGDAALTPANGVRGGSGTAADPYRITGWTLLHDRLSALSLRGTHAHVLIEDVHVPLQTAQMGYRDCLPDPTACPQFIGIELHDAHNVTIRASSVALAENGIRVHGGSSDVLVEGVTIGAGGSRDLPGNWGIVVRDASRVTLRGIVVMNVLSGFHLQDATDVAVERSRFDAANITTQGVSLFSPLDGVTLRENRFDQVKVFPQGELRNLTIVRNEFDGPTAGFGNGAVGSYRGALFCGNVFTGGATAIASGNAWDVRIVGNRMEGNRYGVDMGPAVNLTMERNLVTGHAREGVWIQGTGITLRDNAIHGNLRAFLPSHGTDARGNWWGDASGPRGIGPGSGEVLATLPGSVVDYSGWLTSAPDLSDPCQGPAQPQAAPPREPLRAGVEARAKATLPGVGTVEISLDPHGEVDLGTLLP